MKGRIAALDAACARVNPVLMLVAAAIALLDLAAALGRLRSRQLCAHAGRLASLPTFPRADITCFFSDREGRRLCENALP